jgi:hypothetical protein
MGDRTADEQRKRDFALQPFLRQQVEERFQHAGVGGRIPAPKRVNSTPLRQRGTTAETDGAFRFDGKERRRYLTAITDRMPSRNLQLKATDP